MNELNFQSLKLDFPHAKTRLEFFVNNEHQLLDNVDPKTTLLRFLRENGYVGTKYGCGEGGCGACCVVVAEFDADNGRVRYRTANSCLMPLCATSGKQVLTVEGIGCPENPHPIQERFAKGNASQCGFCTPGFVMSLYGLLKISPDPSIGDIEEAFDGNLCRCTGYRPILETARSFIKKSPSPDPCKSTGQRNLVDFDECKAYDPNDDPGFPSQLAKTAQTETLLLSNESSLWLKPSSLEELLRAKQIWPSARLIGGNSEVGIEMNLRPLEQPSVFIYIGDLPELREVKIEGEFLEIGVNITLTGLIESLERLKKTCRDHQKSLFNAFLSNLRWFASRHVRNFATLGGNITTGSPISDLNPILVAMDALLTVRSRKNGERSINMRNFFLAYRKINMAPDEVLQKVTIPLPSSHLEIVYAYKQAKRKSDDIALVNGCYRVLLDETHRIQRLDVSLGGVSQTTVYLDKLSENCKNLLWGEPETLTKLEKDMLDEVQIDYSAPGAHPSYRRTLVLSFLTRFWYQTLRELGRLNRDPKIDEIKRSISSSSQDVFSSDHEPHLGSTSPHVAALLHSTGVATFTDDIGKQQGELFAWPVMSSKAHALILSVDESKALALKGVHAFVSHKDVPNSNTWKDEEFFASREVLFHGQFIGLVVAESPSLAKKAAHLVEIEYEELKAVLTIDEAIEADSFYSHSRNVLRGKIDDSTFDLSENESDLVHEGTFEMGSQEHFYMETFSCVVIPKRESNEWEIHSSTQFTGEMQECAALALGIPKNRIVSVCKRIGGGFGGKETRICLIAIPCVVAANKLKRPVRCALDRDVDMIMSGKRHSFKSWYKVRVSRDGMFKAYDLRMVNNAGHSLDMSAGVIDRAITHAENVYRFPNMRASGKIAKTNIASNTAFRGFGAPQAVATTETMITEVAELLGIDQAKIRLQNMFQENDVSIVNSVINDWHLPEMMKDTMRELEASKMRQQVDKFNQENVWKKRGLAIVPTRYAIGFSFKHLNQGAALVHIYTDGSVLVHTAGIEMGQGLFTKLIHITANSLNIPEKQIYISETSTNTIPNGAPSAASVSTDIQGMAVMNACELLSERLRPYREKNPSGSLADWAHAAFVDRVSLSATGFYKTPNIDYDKALNIGNPYAYYTDGLSVSLVELDVLTGDHTILRSDVFMDLGKSINYSIDVGQVEGAFVHGIGLFTIEDVLHVSKTGAMATKGPGAYKIPTASDIPQEFNVKFLKDKEYKNLNNLKKSKGIGEPPLQLAFSVFLALRDAVSYARKENKASKNLLKLDSPATSQALRMGCQDRIFDISQVYPKDKEEKLFYKRP